jgi:uroporphyrinogen decarboxylase
MSTPRQVVDALLRRQPAERVALRESPWADTIAAWVQQGYPTRTVHKEVGDYCWNPTDGRYALVETAGEYVEPVPAWEHFGFDMVGVGPWFDLMPLRGFESLEAETDEWTIKRNGAGAALKYWKHKSGTPEHIDFRMTSREVWERDYRPHLLELDPQRIDVQRGTKYLTEAHDAGVWTHFGNMFVWELMRQSMGDVTLYQSVLLDPAWVHDYNRVYTDFYITHYKYLFENVGLPDGIWLYEDLGYKNGLFASPKVLSEIVFPYYRELIDFWHGYDLPVVLHTCGSTKEALPMIVDVGFDALNPMERKAAGNDPFAFAEEYGDRISFVGGLDARVLETNDLEYIGREVAAYIEGMKARGASLVFCTDHSVSPNTRYASYLHAVQAYREHMLY